MKRGEIWTVAGSSEYSGKPRPAVVVQDERFDTSSVTVCLMTTTLLDTRIAGIAELRPQLIPSELNGLRETSQIMVDKLASLRTEKLGARIGELSEAEVQELDDALLIFLGLARRVGNYGQFDR